MVNVMFTVGGEHCIYVISYENYTVLQVGRLINISLECNVYFIVVFITHHICIIIARNVDNQLIIILSNLV